MANVIKTYMVGHGQMVVFLGSYLIGLFSVGVLWVRFIEARKRFIQRREGFMVGELGVWEER